MTPLRRFYVVMLSRGVDLRVSDPSIPPLDIVELNALAGILVDGGGVGQAPPRTSFDYHFVKGDDADPLRSSRTDNG